MITVNPIDIGTFRGLQDTAGADFVAELVDTFVEEAPRMLQALRDALAGGHAEAFRRAAHSLKSNAQTFGALALGTRACEVELCGLPATAAAGAALLDALQDDCARATAALEALRHG